MQVHGLIYNTTTVTALTRANLEKQTTKTKSQFAYSMKLHTKSR